MNHLVGPLGVLLCALAVNFGPVDAQPAGAQSLGPVQTRTVFESIAEQLPYLSLDQVLWRRAGFPSFDPADPEDVVLHARFLALVTDGSHPEPELLELLAHHDPKVRTLAAVALFDMEIPSVLPELAALREDAEATFNGRPELAKPWTQLAELGPLGHGPGFPRNSGFGPPPKDQVVGWFASRMIHAYLEPAGYREGGRGRARGNFADYWEERGDRPHCASWFELQLMRASQRRSPLPPDFLTRMQAVRSRIDELDPNERAWTLLGLSGWGSRHIVPNRKDAFVFVSEAELLDACRQLGPRRLMQMLRGEIESDDPDLQADGGNHERVARMVSFVLSHAGVLLRPEDGGALLPLEAQQASWIAGPPKLGVDRARWAIAAAQIERAIPGNQGMAAERLHLALSQLDQETASNSRSALCVSLWRLCGESELNYILDRVFEAGPLPRLNFGTFVHNMAHAPRGSVVLSKLIQDERLSTLGMAPLKTLIYGINALSEKPCIDWQLIQDLRNPLGHADFDSHLERAKREHPEETAQLLEQLERCRRSLIASVPEWHADEAE